MASGKVCFNWKEETIANGERFIPDKAEPCRSCVCNDGIANACQNVHCIAPNCAETELAQQVEGECCEYYCIALPDHNQDGDGNDVPGIVVDPSLHSPFSTFNRSMRLVASTVTTVLILGLLLYIFYRLKKRRVLVMMRRMRTDREDDNVAYVSNFNTADVGMSFAPFGDLPPPYSPPKGPDIDDTEPPPPYEATEGQTPDLSLEPSRNGYIPLNESMSEHEGNQSHDLQGHATTTHISSNNTGHSQGSGTIPHGASNGHCYLNGTACSPQSELQQDVTSPAQLATKPDEHLKIETQFKVPNISQKARVRSLMVGLDRNGKTKSYCQQATLKTAGNDSSRSNSNSAHPNNGTMVTSGGKNACKKRHKCPHAKKARAAVKSCSFRDEYSQTMPALSNGDTEKSVGNKRMCSSYHASTNTDCGLEDFEADDDCGRGSGNNITDMVWNKGHEDTVEEGSTSMQNNSAISCQRVATEASHINDMSDAKRRTAESSFMGTTPEDGSSINDSKPVQVSDGSQSSVCSETGEKRISGHSMDDEQVSSSPDQMHLMNVSGGSGDFNSLREAMKGEHIHQEPASAGCDHSNSLTNVLNSQDVDQSRMIEGMYNLSDTSWVDSDKDTCIDIYNKALTSDNAENETFKAAEEVIGDNTDENDRSSDGYKSESSCVNKTSGNSPGHRKSRNGPIFISPPVKSSDVHLPDEVIRIGISSAKGTGVKNKLMTRSACTAAECGLDSTANPEDNRKSSSFEGSISNRLRKEHIKKKDSPEAYRRLSMAYTEGNSFKQYGFIDMPHSIENMENMMRDKRSTKSTNKISEGKKEIIEKQVTEQDEKNMVNLGCVIQDKTPTKKSEAICVNNHNKINKRSRLSKNDHE